VIVCVGCRGFTGLQWQEQVREARIPPALVLTTILHGEPLAANVATHNRYHFTIYNESRPETVCVTSARYHYARLEPNMKAEELKPREKVVLIGNWEVNGAIFSVDQILPDKEAADEK
jgi:hypothetical protein